MIAQSGRNRIERATAALTVVLAFTHGPALARAQTPAGRAKAAAPAAAAAKPTTSRPEDQIKIDLVKIPVNPTDAIATVNGKAITRQQLADECIARKGQEILDTLIARELLDQALHAKKIDVTSDEVNAQITTIAMRMAGVPRDTWLRTLEKEKGISPVMYAKDVIYPDLALRKLAKDRVQVTEAEIKQAYEANFGAKLRCRMIMVTKLREAQEIWEELRKDPGAFEKIAQARSVDQGTRSIGGLLSEPITRHAAPLSVSEGAFRQLYDLDPTDLKRPENERKYVPKDGDYTGAIQVEPDQYVILQRVGVIPPQNVDITNAAVRERLKQIVYDIKMQEAMKEVFDQLTDAAQIDNHLTGKTKIAHEMSHEDTKGIKDQQVELMSNPGASVPEKSAAPDASGRMPTAAPVGVNPDDIRRMQEMRKPPVKPGS